MPGKRNSGFAKVLDEYIKGYINEAVSFFFSLIERRMMRYMMFFVVMLASVTVIVYGIGSFLGYFFPSLVPGTTHIIVGLLFILAAQSYVKRS